MTYQILKNNTVVKTLTAKSMASIYNQFNNYAKKRGATSEERSDAVGSMVWILPSNDVLSLSAAT